MNLTVGVVISCYNSEKFLEKTINSVLSQNYPINEIIVVDDGSTDSTVMICKKFGSLLTLLYHDDYKNKGQADSLNVGIKYSKSELIAFLDHDDIWYAEKIRKQVDVFKNKQNIGLCYVNGFVINEYDKQLYPIIPNNFVESNQPEKFLLNCHIRTPSMVMVRRSLFDSIVLFSNQIFPPDHDMWIRIGERAKFFYLDEQLIGYRQHSSQISSTKNRIMWEEQFKVLENAVCRYPYSFLVQCKRKAVLYYRLGLFDYKQKCFISAAKNFSMAFLHDPLRSIKHVATSIKSKF